MKYFLTVLLIFISVSVFAECPHVSEKIENLIKHHADSIKGSEYCKYRKVYNEQNIELVLYSIEGPCYKDKSPAGSCGNHYFTTLIGIINGIEYPPVTVGGKGVFHTKSIDYLNDVIVVKGLAYKDLDPLCCPSVEESRYYQIKQSKILSIKP